MTDASVGTAIIASDAIYFAKAASGNVIALFGEKLTTLTRWGPIRLGCASRVNREFLEIAAPSGDK